MLARFGLLARVVEEDYAMLCSYTQRARRVVLSQILSIGLAVPETFAQTSPSGQGRPGEFEVGFSQLSGGDRTYPGLGIVWTVGDSSTGVGLLFSIEALSHSDGSSSGADAPFTLTSIYGGLKFSPRSCQRFCGFAQIAAGGTGVELQTSAGAAILSDKAFMFQPSAGVDVAASTRIGLRAQVGWRATLTDVEAVARGWTLGIGLTFGRW